MTIFEAILLGIIQGLTEFLPISSSGHLVIGQKMLGISVAGNVFEIVVHLGTLVSVLIVFWNDIWQLLTSFKSESTRNYFIAIAILDVIVQPDVSIRISGNIMFQIQLDSLSNEVDY